MRARLAAPAGAAAPSGPSGAFLLGTPMARGQGCAGLHTCGPGARTHWPQVRTTAHTCAGRGGAWRKKAGPGRMADGRGGSRADWRKGRDFWRGTCGAGPVSCTRGRTEGVGAQKVRPRAGPCWLARRSGPAESARRVLPRRLSPVPGGENPDPSLPQGTRLGARSSSASQLSGVPGRTCVGRGGMPCPLAALRVGGEGARAPLSARQAGAGGPCTGTAAEGGAGAPDRDLRRIPHPEPD